MLDIRRKFLRGELPETGHYTLNRYQECSPTWQHMGTTCTQNQKMSKLEDEHSDVYRRFEEGVPRGQKKRSPFSRSRPRACGNEKHED